MTKVKLQNSKPTMWGVVLVVFLVVIVGYIIYKIVNTKSEGFAIDTSKRYILKDINQNDTITFSQNYTAYYSQKYIYEPPTPVSFTLIPGPTPIYSVDIGLPTPIESQIGTSDQGNGKLITDIRYIDGGNNSGTLKYKNSNNNTYYDIPVSVIPYVAPTTTSGATSTTAGATSTTSGATSTTSGATTTTRSALNAMLDSIQSVIDSSNDMLESPRYKFIDNQQRLDTLAQRIDTLMNNLQLTKSISIPEKPKEVTFY